jgi:hypothetical protein
MNRRAFLERVMLCGVSWQGSAAFRSAGRPTTNRSSFLAGVGGAPKSGKLGDPFRDFPTVMDFGAKGEGVSDDSVAFNNALASEAVVLVPPRKYVIGDVQFNDGNALIGWGAGPMYGTDDRNSASRPILIAKRAASVVLNVNDASGIRIEGLLIDGVNRAPDGISGGGHRGTIHNVTVVNCNNGLGGTHGGSAYSTVLRISDCEFGNNNIGLANLIDSTIATCAFSNNLANGVTLQAGANANNFVGCRFEWNGRYGMILDGCNTIQIIGGLFDRNTCAGLIVKKSQAIVSGVMLYRNAARNSGQDAISHIYVEDVKGLVLTGCGSRAGQNDGGGGMFSPAYAIEFIGTSANVVITGNDLSGYVSAPLSGKVPTSSFVFANNLT